MTSDVTDSVVQADKPDGPQPDPMAKLRLYVTLIFALSVVAVMIAGFTITTDKAVILPGSARPTEEAVEVNGLPEFPSEGEFLFTTVSVNVEPSLFEYWWLQLDDDHEIVEKQVVLGDRTKEENTERNLTLMTDSKGLAAAVALERLGYDAFESTGVFIGGVSEGEAADGIIEPGDVVVGLDGEDLLSSSALIEALKLKSPGDSVTVSLIRAADGEAEDVTIVLGIHPDDPERGFLGVGPSDIFEIAELPIEVDIDSGRVGGPSAGLAFTLTVIDVLTEGELSGGGEVAVTGTIRADGSVGAVGGVPQKTAAVRDQGVKLFIVPSALDPDILAEVRAAAQGEVEIVAVDNLDQALEALRQRGGDVASVDEFALANTQ